jgi:hypothetical protein
MADLQHTGSDKKLDASNAPIHIPKNTLQEASVEMNLCSDSETTNKKKNKNKNKEDSFLQHRVIIEFSQNELAPCESQSHSLLESHSPLRSDSLLPVPSIVNLQQQPHKQPGEAAITTSTATSRATSPRSRSDPPPPPSSTKNTRKQANLSPIESTNAAAEFLDASAVWLNRTFSREEVQGEEQEEQQLLQNQDLVPDDATAESDDASVTSRASSTYFAPSDFNPSNWIQAMDAPTIGFAVIALTTVLAHPFLFVAGALAASAAFGTATAVGASYDLISRAEGPLSRCFCNTSLTGGASSTDPINGSIVLATLDTEQAQKIQAEQDPTDEATAESSSTPKELVGGHASTQPEGKSKGTAASVASPYPHKRMISEATMMTLDNDVPPELPEEWLREHYPPLKNQVVKDEKMMGLSAVQFFKVFFNDDAPYNFLEFQKKRGDIDIKYGPWQDLECETGPISMHPRAKQLLPSDLGHLFFQERTLKFKAKTNSFFGPLYATTTKRQRILMLSKRCAVLESKTSLADIPYSDRFTVMERWVITATKDEDRYTARVATACEVFFTKSCPFEGQIRSKSAITISEVVTAWCAMAQEALKLTERAKRDRIRRIQTDEDESWDDPVHDDGYSLTADDMDAVEVKNSHSRLLSSPNASIVGEEYLSEEMGEIVEGLSRSESEKNLASRKARPLTGFRRSISQMVGRRRQSLPRRAEI